MAYATYSDLQAALGTVAMRAIFDDANTGSPDPTMVATILSLASARVDSYIARSYKGPFPVPPNPATGMVPSLLLQATLEWARAMAFERHPEYGRDYSEDAKKFAHQVSERLADSTEFLTDSVTQSVPGTVGGVVLAPVHNMTLPFSDGSSNGDF